MGLNLFKKFDELTTDYFNQIKAIEHSYFMKGKSIENAKTNKQEDIIIYLLVCEYTCVMNLKMLINIFRFLTNKQNVESNNDPREMIRFYESIVKGMIRYDKRIRSLNTLDKELYLSNPSESGLIDILNKFDNDLHSSFYNFDVFTNNPKDSYLFDIVVSLKTMIASMRILLVNSIYQGKKHNKFFIISKQIYDWLDITLQEIGEVVKNKE